MTSPPTPPRQAWLICWAKWRTIQPTVSSEGTMISPIPVPTIASTDQPPIPLTVTQVLEHGYCPRFTYFEHVLAIPEHQERRPLVLRGRQVHEERKRINPGYLRKKLGVVERN